MVFVTKKICLGQLVYKYVLMLIIMIIVYICIFDLRSPFNIVAYNKSLTFISQTSRVMEARPINALFITLAPVVWPCPSMKCFMIKLNHFLTFCMQGDKRAKDWGCIQSYVLMM